MYADDLVMLSESPEGLQKCMDKLKAYTLEWGLQINKEKTKVLIFQRCGRRTTPTFLFGDLNISIADTYKYLGTTLTYTGSFKTNTNIKKKKGFRAAYLINNNISKISKASTSIKIFEKVVEPILTYNSEVTEAHIPTTWDYDKFKNKIWDTGHELNKVVLGSLRQIMGVHKKTTNIALMAETGKFPLCLKIYTQITKYWMRLRTTKNSMLHEAYNISYNDNLDKKKSWMKIVQFLLDYTEMTGENMPSSPKDIDGKMKLFKSKLIAKFKKWWETQAVVTGTKKLDFYFKYKKNFSFETYLDNIPRGTRIPLTKLRTSCHNLPIETGRYSKKKIERKDRICPLCRLNEVGDEEHYLRRCSNDSLLQTRRNFITQMKEKIPQMINFSPDNIIDYCMVLNDPNIQLPFAIYAKEIIDMFTEIKKLQPNENVPLFTKSGRQVIKPIRLIDEMHKMYIG